MCFIKVNLVETTIARDVFYQSRPVVGEGEIVIDVHRQTGTHGQRQEGESASKNS